MTSCCPHEKRLRRQGVSLPVVVRMAWWLFLFVEAYQSELQGSPGPSDQPSVQIRQPSREQRQPALHNRPMKLTRPGGSGKDSDTNSASTLPFESRLEAARPGSLSLVLDRLARLPYLGLRH